jgi:hypothetical protein
MVSHCWVTSRGSSHLDGVRLPAPGDPPRKFYVVRRGRSLGIYYSWTDCSSQVTGFSNAEFKSFKSFAEARNYLTK